MDEGWEGGKCNSDVVEVMMTVDEFFRDQDPEFFYVGICFMYMFMYKSNEYCTDNFSSTPRRSL